MEDETQAPSITTCQSELQAAALCVGASPESCSCFQGDFSKVFPISVEGAYRDVLLHQASDDPEFCSKASNDVCE